MLDVMLQLEQLDCVRQSDSSGSEPYMWILFFFADSTTVSSRAGTAVRTINMLEGVSGRQIFPSNVVAGRMLSIPENLGRIRLVLDDTVIKKPAAGVVFTVLEENDTTDGLMRIGHREFGEALSDELNGLVSRFALADVPPLTNEERAAIAKRVQDRVKSAIEGAASGWEFFKKRDRVIGFGADFFSWDVLQLIKDLAPGKPYPLQHIVRSERVVVPGGPGTLPRTVVDEYEVTGSIRVNIFTPPPVDPCQAEKDGFNRLNQAVKDLDQQIASLQEELNEASGTQKPGILKQIDDARKERKKLLPELDAARDAFQTCRAQHPARP
jgi:hypothetical protein